MPPTPYDLKIIAQLPLVSRETVIEKLVAFEALIHKWQKHINLTANHEDLWRRHICDSLQLLPYLPAKPTAHIDIGSGAGFPGLILAMAGAPNIHLIESDVRKVSFLKEAARVTQAKVTLHNARAEKISLHGDVITARACAPLERLISLTHHFWLPQSIGLFLKGKNYKKEIEEAQKKWFFDYHISPSLTDSEGVIIKIMHVRRTSQ